MSKRTGIIAALLGVRPEEIKETRLLPTILRKEYEDDKYGILDVRVEMHSCQYSGFCTFPRG